MGCDERAVTAGDLRRTSRASQVEVRTTLDGLEDDWDALAEHSGSVFATRTWLWTWWRHFGRERPLRIVVSRDGDRPVAISPLYLAARRPVRVLRFLGHGPTDALGPICHPDERARAAGDLQHVLDDTRGDWDVLLADELPGTLDWANALGGTALGRQASPVVTLTGTTWDAWLASRSPGLRSSLRRSHRALDALGPVRFRHTTRAEDLPVDLATLLRLHRLRWASVGGSRAFARREAFHAEVVRLALAAGWLRLWFVDVDGAPVAALYNLRFGGAESFYQSGRDPQLARGSPGLVLHAHAIEQAFADGLREYRLLRGDEPYKRRLADHDPGLSSVAVAASTPGRLVAAAVRPLPRLPRWAVRRVPAALAWGTGGSPAWSRP